MMSTGSILKWLLYPKKAKTIRKKTTPCLPNKDNILATWVNR